MVKWWNLQESTKMEKCEVMGWGEGGGMFEVMGWKEEWAGTGAQGDIVRGGERRAI